MKRCPPVIKEIKKLQNTTHNLIPKSSLGRLVKEMVQNQNFNFRVTKNAVTLIQGASEDYLIKYLSAANEIAITNDRETITKQDMKLVAKVRDLFSA
jgi:histone H3/H4